MKRELVRLMGGILLGAAMLVALTACGGSAGSAAPASSAPAANTAPATNTQPATQPGSQAGGDEVLAKGKLIFDKTAGGTGCAYCHGFDGKGAGPSGLNAPANRGKSETAVRDALKNAQMMSFIKLTDEEITAVVAYLQYLNEQP